MSAWRNSYRVVRSVLLSVILTVVVIYVGLYVVISIPSVQNKIKERVEKEVSTFLKTDVSIQRLEILPFNEVRVSGLKINDPNGEKCLYVDQLAAGISLMRLLRDKRIILTYAEILGLDADIWQQAEGAPLNIQFLIDAFSPKDKSKPPTKFDLRLHNVVIRKSSFSFNKRWKPYKESGRFDPDHISISDFKADVSLPRLSNDDFKIDVRRLSFNEKCGLEVKKISLLAHITPKSISVSNLRIQLPNTLLTPSDFSLNFESFKDLGRSLETGSHSFVIVDNTISLPDLKGFFPPLADFTSPLIISLSLTGNSRNFSIHDFSVHSLDRSLSVDLGLDVAGLYFPEKGGLNLERLQLNVSPLMGERIGKVLSSDIFGKIFAITGGISLDAKGNYTLDGKDARLEADLLTEAGSLKIVSEGMLASLKDLALSFHLNLDEINLGSALSDPRMGLLSMNAEGNVRILDKEIDGDVASTIENFEFNGNQFSDVWFNLAKNGKRFSADISSKAHSAAFEIDGEGTLDGPASSLALNAAIYNLNLYDLGFSKGFKNYDFSGNIKIDANGDNIDNICCDVTANNLSFRDPISGEGVLLKYFELKTMKENDNRYLSFYNDWAEGFVNGRYTFSSVVPFVKNLLHSSLPSVIDAAPGIEDSGMFAEYSVKVKPRNPLLPFLKIPWQLGSDLAIKGKLNAADSTATLTASVPYIIQGGKKLIKDTKVVFSGRGGWPGLALNASTIWPVKNGEAQLNLDLNAFNDKFNTMVDWNVRNDKGIHGSLALSGETRRNHLSSTPDLDIKFKPSEFYINNAKWNVAESSFSWSGKELRVDGLNISHDSQFVKIGGEASADPASMLTINLEDIDLDYIFNTLNINFVTFGGHASGELTASRLFSGKPEAATKRFFVKDLSYNGGVLGDADIASHFDFEDMEVVIEADIREKGERRALIDGGIWVTRDSLSFSLDANKVNVKFLQPFMSAFASDFKGKASGKAKLYGTFKDIDLTGRIFADTLAMKLGFTNVWYSGSDSVILTPGHINIPGFKLYDRQGHSALLSGNLTHRYFHEPEFEFKVSDAKSLLCYDTNAKMNPDWFGTIYGNGSALLRGRPGYVGLSVDMTTAPGSSFTFVLSETQEAQDYDFLTFSDRRKEELEFERKRQTKPLIEETLISSEEEGSSIFSMDIRGTVTPSAEMTLVMDPKAGDKIIAHGAGAMQIGYDTESDELTMYGKYTLEEGNYNFSLQDLILKDFTIRPGSSISFNGDPLQALLNITATYRVNTNLSDLDKSFATDKELNRTNVPVDAVLKVDGDMRDPSISLDIDLPTLTAETERKVRSIISTEDMMNRQIIYLLALNKFYTPEYMGGTGSGGELASMASSTLSSQISNMLGQLTNKFTLSPSFRSDKGDFSDMEVDVALSSRLLDNRLLLNGNFGYRDRSTSQTTFIGDFDIEYLLNRGGNLRLKAYNHFNDQNYYLKSSLTTQGIGIVYRRDFDNPFTFLRRRRSKPVETTPTDSVNN